ncbi:MAG TPA: hypothetical protein ENG70_04175 [Candidatus Cloacimonetes bacterium]|nr:hypothetical protein [Candidatus Cloacimonadota bacterium]HEX38040.1 hypothetical protein [Candidatus Cloacimonadota bacterium]
MKYKNTLSLGLLILVIIILGILALVHMPGQKDTLQPQLNKGEKWKIAYYEGGQYIDFAENLRGIIKGLGELGWIQPIHIPEFQDADNAYYIWNYAANNCSSDYIKFLEKEFWSSSWNDSLREVNRKLFIDQLNENEIDLVIAMGTWAGQDLVNDLHTTPVIVLNSSEPLHAGIISDPNDSGYDNIFVEYDPNRYKKQIELFHDFVGFERLGVTFEDSEDGRIYSNIDDLEQISKECGFKLIMCHAPDVSEDISEEQAFRAVKRCYESLAPMIDALWIGNHFGESPQYLPEILKPLYEFNIPTWSSSGEIAVKRGVLMSVTHQNFKEVGKWYAKIIAQIFNGKQPRSIKPYLEKQMHILFNRETAKRIEFKIPEALLEIADKIYDTIEGEGRHE